MRANTRWIDAVGDEGQPQYVPTMAGAAGNILPANTGISLTLMHRPGQGLVPASAFQTAATAHVLRCPGDALCVPRLYAALLEALRYVLRTPLLFVRISVLASSWHDERPSMKTGPRRWWPLPVCVLLLCWAVTIRLKFSTMQRTSTEYVPAAPKKTPDQRIGRFSLR